MAETLAPPSACILRVDVYRCSECSEKVKRRLQEIKGVNLVDINTKKGLVIVSGVVDPPTLQKAITKTGRRAEVVAYEKDPVQAKKKLEQFIRSSQKEHGIRDEKSCCCGKESRDADKPVPVVHDQPCYGMESEMAPPAWYEQTSVGPRFYGAAYHVLPPRYPTPMAPYSYTGRPYGYHGHRPPVYATLPPLQPTLPPPAPMNASWLPLQQTFPPPPPRPQIPLSNLHAVCGGQKDVPAGNSIYHAFSDDNAAACSIM
ncbi:hypothetical protein OIU77_021074 [Salix suchowensis]|uniref:HMA domain-containing protein n=1 Tax=Salix suchowensis TaxID=1278906 RepID=A0ABQ9CBS8_9ROSI|nr:heavy-metal-associated domain-containing family protein [Salix suchowensis]KAJ6368568.1 hypothetical protein OIU78_001038 [Salix suchowensis]KAJ6395949.1 hypothetical protein OIU77_021074 [Salix suchowensis]